MTALELKQALLDTVSKLDDKDTDVLQQITQSVKAILSNYRKKEESREAKDGISPFVSSMRTGVKLPSDIDVKSLRNEYLEKKYL